jgi:hypothetical protein
MKRNWAAIIALVLWLLFVASNAFAVFKSPYPPKSYPPEQTVVVGVGEGSRRRQCGQAKIAMERVRLFLQDSRCACECRYVADASQLRAARS